MIVNSRNYESFIDECFTVLPNTINIHSVELTVDDFNLVTNSEEARSAKNVVYIWKTEQPIPRVTGSSSIIYIGQTKRSIFNRHGNSTIKAESNANRQKYNAIVRNYGAISISYIELNRLNKCNQLDLLSAEGQFLWWYFQNHCEYPPINYTKTKIRNEQITFIE